MANAILNFHFDFPHPSLIFFHNDFFFMTLATSLPLKMPSQRDSSAAREKKERSSGGAETDSDDVTVVLRVSLDPSLTPTEPQPWTNQSKPPSSTYSHISWSGQPLCL